MACCGVALPRWPEAAMLSCGSCLWLCGALLPSVVDRSVVRRVC
jgi:hypothetical protein